MFNFKKSTLSLLALLATTSLSGALYQNDPNDGMNIPEDRGMILRSDSNDNSGRGSYWRQDGYFQSQPGNYNQDYYNRGPRNNNDSNWNNNERGYYDQSGYPGDRGMSQPQPQCASGRCGYQGGYSSNTNMRSMNQNYAGRDNDEYRNQNFAGSSAYDRQHSGQYTSQYNNTQYSNQRMSDRNMTGNDDLSNKVRSKIQSDSSLAGQLSNITISADEGTVMLKGTVNSETDKSKAENLALQVEGVKSVTNKLTTK